MSVYYKLFGVKDKTIQNIRDFLNNVFCLNIVEKVVSYQVESFEIPTNKLLIVNSD